MSYIIKWNKFDEDGGPYEYFFYKYDEYGQNWHYFPVGKYMLAVEEVAYRFSTLVNARIVLSRMNIENKKDTGHKRDYGEIVKIGVDAGKQYWVYEDN